MPPVAVTVMVVVPPAHAIAGDDADALIGGSEVIVVVVVAVHELMSLTVIVKVPVPSPVKIFDAWKLTPSMEYTKDPVPPDAETVKVVEPPPHWMTGAEALTKIAGGAMPIVR